MDLNKIEQEKLLERMLIIKILTLDYHLSSIGVKKYYECDFEFEAKGEGCIPINLHTWVGRNHRYKEKYHKVFVVPDELRIPLIIKAND